MWEVSLSFNLFFLDKKKLYSCLKCWLKRQKSTRANNFFQFVDAGGTAEEEEEKLQKKN